MKLFSQKFLKLLKIYFLEKLILDFWLGSNYASALRLIDIQEKLG